MNTIDLFITFTSAFGIWYLCFWRFRELRIERFRGEIFAIRDEMFIAAAEGKISFDHPAYTKLRVMLNGYIRFSHRLSLLYVVIQMMCGPTLKASQGFEEVLKESAAGLTPEMKKTMEDYYTRAQVQLIYFLLMSSLTKAILFVPVILIFFAYKFNRHSSKATNRAKEREDENWFVQNTYDGLNQTRSFRDSINKLNYEAFVSGKLPIGIAT